MRKGNSRFWSGNNPLCRHGYYNSRKRDGLSCCVCLELELGQLSTTHDEVGSQLKYS